MQSVPTAASSITYAKTQTAVFGRSVCGSSTSEASRLTTHPCGFRKPDAGKSLQFSSSPCSLNNYLHRVCTKKPQLLSPALLCNREAKKCPHWCEQQRRRVESAVPASQGKRHRIKVPNDPTKRDGRERGQRTQWPSLTISCSQVPISPPCFSNCEPTDTSLEMLVQIVAPNRIKLKIENVLSRTGATKPSGDRSSFLTCRPQCRT